MLFTYSSIHHIQKKSLAFTLAEVIIILGIIGIVVQLTIPSVYKSYQNRVNITKFTSMYAKLSNAHNLMVNQDQPSWHPDPRFNNGTFANGILKYFNVAQTCSTDAPGTCWPSQNFYQGGTPVVAGQIPTSAYVLGDGSFISFEDAGNVCNAPEVFACSSDRRVGEVISIDVNGFKGPNMWGADQFFFIGTVDKFNPGYTIGGGRECGYNITMGNSNGCGY
jgi:type II secretory pathway pseudopilin PulG